MPEHMIKDKVADLVNTAISKREDLFVLQLTVGGDNSIKIVLGGDQGVSLNDCMEISRAVEHNLDREEVDFSIEVTSAGATAPLELPRQYHKNVGRSLEVKTEAGKLEGQLTAVNEEGIVLEWKSREPKPVGKGKHTVKKREEIAFPEIQEAKVILKF